MATRSAFAGPALRPPRGAASRECRDHGVLVDARDDDKRVDPAWRNTFRRPGEADASTTRVIGACTSAPAASPAAS